MKRCRCIVMILFLFCCLIFSVSAEETVDYLGTVEEFQTWANSESSTYSTLNLVRRVGKIGGLGHVSYLSIMTIDGIQVYCIEPEIYAATGEDYTVDWGKISESTKQRLFRLTNVGYGRLGHDGDDWFVATQLAVWRALGFSHLSAQTLDGQSWDVSWQIAEIERLADSFGSESSFNNQIIECELNVPQTLVDTNGVLSHFRVNSVNGVQIVQNQNELTLTVNSRNYQKTISGSQGLTSGGLVYVHPGSQSVYMVHHSSEPISYQLRLKLKTGDLKLTKEDAYGQPAAKKHVFEIEDETGEKILWKDSTRLTLSNATLLIKDVLTPGRYVLREIETSYPYLLSDEEVEFVIQEDETSEVVFANQMQNVSLSVLKKDSESKELLNGAEFEISVKENEEWRLVDSDTTGKSKVLFPVSWADKQVKLYTDEQCQVLLGTFLVDQVGEIDLTGLNFSGQVYAVNEEQETILSEILNLEGEVLSRELKYGQQVRVCEVKAPEGYELSAESCQQFVITPEEGVPYQIEFENKLRKLDVVIYKCEMGNRNILLNDAFFEIEVNDELVYGMTGRLFLQLQQAGQSVELYRDMECTDLICTAVSDKLKEVILELDEKDVYVKLEESVQHYELKEGAVVLKDLPYGTQIRVYEVAAPSGYERNDSCLSFEVKSEKEVMEVYYENKKIVVYDVPKMGLGDSCFTWLSKTEPH